METTAMAVLTVVLVVALLGGFFFAWGRDKKRSEAVAEDPARLDTDTSTTSTPERH